MTLPWMAAKILLRPVAELRAHTGNARMHSAEQVEQIKASMLAFGFTNPLLVDEAGVLIAGHGRLEAAASLGLEKVPVITLRHLSAPQKEALRLADNRIAENATWDQALLRDALAAAQASTDLDLAALGFSADELNAILADADNAATAGDVSAEAAAPDERVPAAVASAEANDIPADDPADAEPDAPRQAVTRPGDLWLLGEHRLLCGDSTDAAAVARIMGQDRAALLFTSPPYGNQRDYTTGGVTDSRASQAWDALMQGVFRYLDLAVRPDAQVLVNLGLIHRDNEWQPYWQGWLDWMRARGWRRFGLYTWDQGPGLPGDWNGRLAPAFELLFHFNREARRPNKIIPCRWAGHINSEKGGLRAKDGTVGEWQHAGQGVQETRTAGVDVQDDRLECDVWGWAEGFSSWLVDHVVIQGSPREREPWDALATLLARDWPRAGGGAIQIAKICVDTGGRDTAAVYGHLRRLRNPRIAPTKGVDGWNRAQPVQGPTPVDAMVDGRKLRRGLKLWTVSVSTWKADLYRRLWLGRGEAENFPPGWVHLPRAIEADWVKQLVSEQLQTVKDRRGFARQEWVKLRDRNEALDCAVLARAALWLLGADRYGERFWQRLREDVSNSAAVVAEAASEQIATAPMPLLTATPTAAPRPSAWLAPRHGWLR